MSKLSEKKCIPCEGGVIPFDISEIHKYQKKVDGWSVIKNDKGFFWFAGQGGYGFQTAPAASQLASDLILRNKSNITGGVIKALSAKRFH